MKHSIVLFSLVVLYSATTLAWGKRGHEIIGSLAAQVLAEKNKSAMFLQNHSFDLGYYSNVPDLYWRKVAGKKEGPQHFIDLEIFDRIIPKNETWSADRKAFFTKHKIPEKAGRAPWRIQEIFLKLHKTTKKLKDSKKTKSKAHKNLQANWLVQAGTLGHYVADLANPMHTTENYDGELTNQKGLHAWFETQSVDELFPRLQNKIFAKALKRWPKFHQQKKSMTPFALSLDLARESHSQLKRLLNIDKKNGRKKLSKVAPKFKALITERMTLAVLYLAQIWSTELGWPYEGNRFYNFETNPEYIYPIKEK